MANAPDAHKPSNQERIAALEEQVAALDARVDKLEEVESAPPAITPVGTVITDPKDVLRFPGVDFRVTNDRKISRTVAGTQAAIVDPVTRDVEALCVMTSSTVGQRNKALNYYTRPITGPDSVWTQIAGTSASAGKLYVAPPAVAAGSVYRATADGRIAAPNGQEWRGKGLNCGTMGVNNLNENLDAFRTMANALAETVPGTNLLRAQVWQVGIDNGLTPEMIQPMVNIITGKGIVVEIEYHDYPTTLTGGRLQQVATWYGRAAALFKPNPMVIFGAQNEPGDPGGVDDMNNALYNAVRQNSDTLFFWTMTGGWSLQGMNAARYRQMRNVGVDQHFYAWEVHGDVNRTCTVAEAYAKLQQIVGQIRGFVSADGPPPVLIGEYGVHGLGGTGFDAGGAQSVAAVQKALDDGLIHACCNWAWRTFNVHGPGMPYIAGDLVIPQWTGGRGSLTQNPAGGQEHANWVAGLGIGFT